MFERHVYIIHFIRKNSNRRRGIYTKQARTLYSVKSQNTKFLWLCRIVGAARLFSVQNSCYYLMVLKCTKSIEGRISDTFQIQISFVIVNLFIIYILTYFGTSEDSSNYKMKILSPNYWQGYNSGAQKLSTFNLNLCVKKSLKDYELFKLITAVLLVSKLRKIFSRMNSHDVNG